MRTREAAVVVGLVVGLISTTAHSAYIVDISQQGANVVASGSGELDISALTQNLDIGSPALVYPSYGSLSLGNGTADSYTGISGPKSFGSGGFSAASTAAGQRVGINETTDSLLVPMGYKSDGVLGISNAVFDNTTIEGLGLKAGSYVYTWGTGADADSFTIDVISSVPLPSSAPMFGAALVALGAVGYRLSRKSKAAAAP